MPNLVWCVFCLSSDFLVEPFPAFTGLYFNLAGMSMFLVTACFCYAFYETSPIRLRDYNVILVKSILCAANALCYGFSGFLNFYHPHERVSSAVWIYEIHTSIQISPNVVFTQYIIKLKSIFDYLIANTFDRVTIEFSFKYL